MIPLRLEPPVLRSSRRCTEAGGPDDLWDSGWLLSVRQSRGIRTSAAQTTAANGDRRHGPIASETARPCVCRSGRRPTLVNYSGVGRATATCSVLRPSQLPRPGASLIAIADRDPIALT